MDARRCCAAATPAGCGARPGADTRRVCGSVHRDDELRDDEPGAVVPNGMMSVVPFNVMGSDLNRYDKDARWWSTPYEYHNKFFTGFAHGASAAWGAPTWARC